MVLCWSGYALPIFWVWDSCDLTWLVNSNLALTVALRLSKSCEGTGSFLEPAVTEDVRSWLGLAVEAFGASFTLGRFSLLRC